jgi:hypothetical protein
VNFIYKKPKEKLHAFFRYGYFRKGLFCYNLKKNGMEHAKTCASPISPNDPQASKTISGYPLFPKSP